jgi:hypothetical protein
VQDTPCAALEEAESLGFGKGKAPDDDRCSGGAEEREGVEDALQTKGFVDQDEVGGLAAGEFQTGGEGVGEPAAFQVGRRSKEDAKPLGGDGLGVAETGGEVRVRAARSRKSISYHE